MIEIIRLEDTQEGSFGVLRLNKRAFCVTLEPPWKHNQQSVSCIPPGLYTASRVVSPKFGNTFEIKCVPGRSAILFHAGNFVDDTHGCVLIASSFGKLKGQRAVLNSGATFKAFMAELVKYDHQEVWITNIL